MYIQIFCAYQGRRCAPTAAGVVVVNVLIICEETITILILKAFTHRLETSFALHSMV